MKKIIILILTCIGSITFTNAQSVDLYFSLSDNDGVQCKFGDVDGCRLFKVPVTLYRNGNSGLLDSVVLDKNNFTELFPPEVRGVQPNVNSDNTYITFLGTKDTAGYFVKHIYAHKLGNSSIFDVSNGQTLITGSFPIWYNDTTILYNSTNYCTPPTNPGCGTGSRYADLTKTTLNNSLNNVNTAYRAWGNINPIANLDSKFCSFEDPDANPINKNLVAFHTDPVIGGTTYDTIPIDCPFTYGLPTNINSPGAEPQPIVAKMDAAANSNLIKDLVPSVDYWKFDLSSAGINGFAHLDWNDSGTVIIGTEQGTISNPYKICSNTIYGSNTAACLSNGGHMVIYDRPWGFELDTTVGMYRNIYHNSSPQQPLFNAKHPAALPKSTLFWNPAIEICTSYRAAKQIQFCGSETTIIATVFCKDNSSAIHFSRMYLIDFADINNPFYFDITGWVEDNFPSRWADGQATAYSATCFVTNPLTAIIEKEITKNEVRIFPNPTTGIIKIALNSNQNTEIKIYNSAGQEILNLKNVTEIDLSNEPTGIYFIVINSKDLTYTAKFMKQQ